MSSRSSDPEENYSPAAERARKVPVRELPLQRLRPPLALRGLASIHDRPGQSVDISTGPGLGSVHGADDVLARELVLVDADLARGDEVERRLAAARRWEGVRCDVRGERGEGLEDDVLVRRPGVGRVPVHMHVSIGYSRRWSNEGQDEPLKTALEEGHGHGAVVPVQHHVDRREEAEGVLRGREELIGDDAVPERVVRRGGEDAVARVGGRVEVVEGELLRVPEEVEDGLAERGGSLGVVSCGGGVVESRVEVSKDDVGVV